MFEEVGGGGVKLNEPHGRNLEGRPSSELLQLVCRGEVDLPSSLLLGHWSVVGRLTCQVVSCWDTGLAWTMHIPLEREKTAAVCK